MGIEKQGSRSGGYGFLQMFDWNAKSRKKLLSSKSDLSEQSKQKQICNGNLQMNHLHMLDNDLMEARSSIKGSTDYSCASSVTDEDFCGTKSPGVVGRLMGLDSLPKSNILDSFSTPLFDTRSLPDLHYRPNNLKCFQDHEIMHSSSLHELPDRNVLELKHHKLISKPIEKFQTEILPAKSIPITRKKLLSPIKSAKFIQPKDAAHIMEAAARIIEPGHQATAKAKTVSSSSVPLKVQDLKEKVQEPRKPSKRSKAYEKPTESSVVYLKGQPRTKKSWRESVDSKSLSVFSDSEECSSGLKSTGKSISLALQAKANVQKREGLNISGSRSLVSQNEQNEYTSTPLFKSQQSSQKRMLKKPSSTRNGSRVFLQNNQKQNCVAERQNSPSVKPFASNSQGGGKAVNGDSSYARKKNSSKLAESSKAGFRRSSLDGEDDRTDLSYSSSEKVTRKKRSTDEDYRFEKNQGAHSKMINKNKKKNQSSSLVDEPFIWDKDNRRKGTDVVSFTFSAPMKRFGPAFENSTEVGDKCKKILVSSDGFNVSKFSFPGHNILQGDALSILLERKLKELTHVVEFPQHRTQIASSPSSHFQDLVPCLNVTPSTMLHNGKTKDGIHKYNPISHCESSFSADHQGSKTRNQCEGVQEEMDHNESMVSEAKNLLDSWLPSPVSVLEQSSFAESCSSLDTVDSISTTGSRQCSSIQAQEVVGMHSLKKFVPSEGDAELSDSASSISLPVTHCGKSTEWEPIYVKEALCNIDLMFKDYALDHACEIINPNLFYQLESRKGMLNGYDLVPTISRRLLFDCVSECSESKCRGYVRGGCKLWAKGVSAIRRKERLAREVYSEILSWRSMADYMVDELVDKDMSSRYGRWLDFEIEAFELGIEIEDRVLNSLLDEVVADILVNDLA